MARVFYAMEMYRAATRVLASRPGRVKERLAAAVVYIMDCQECEPVMEDWCNVKEETRQLWIKLNAKPGFDDLPDVEGCIREMTEEEACFIAEAIYTIENKLRAIYDSSG
jgi:hypothetical protein